MSTNVFADIGLPDPETYLAKARLVQTLGQNINTKGLTRAEVGARLGLNQPEVLALLDGQFRDYSVERLLRFANALG